MERNLTNPENIPGAPPALLFKYAMPHDFATICTGFLKKFNWEPRSAFTAVHSVKQVNEDSIVFYRRHENVQAYGDTWEQVTINRKTKEIESRILQANPDHSASALERTVITPSPEEGRSSVETEVFDCQGNGSAKVEVFKHQCSLLIKAIKFNEWAE